ncbi:MAG: hypothetical protein V1743_06855 [Nanoarchaeota archaeon]
MRSSTEQGSIDDKVQEIAAERIAAPTFKTWRFHRERLPLYLESLAGGVFAYLLVDAGNHTLTYPEPDHQQLQIILATLTVPLWYWTTNVIHGMHAISKRRKQRKIVQKKSEEKKPWTRDNTIGAVLSSGTILLMGVPQMLARNLVKLSDLFLRYYVTSGLKYHTTDGIPTTLAQRELVDKAFTEIGSTLLRLGTATVLLGYAIYKVGSVTSSLFTNKENMRLLSYTKDYTRASAKKEKKLAVLEKHAHWLPTLHLSLMGEYLKGHNYDAAFKELELYMTHPKQKTTPFLRFQSKIGAKRELYTLEKRVQANPDNLRLNIRLASHYLTIGDEDNFQSSKYFFKRCAEISEHVHDGREIDYGLLNALFLEAIQDKEKDSEWQGVVRKIIARPELRPEQIGETSHKVYVKGSAFTQNVIIFKEKDALPGADPELENTQKIQGLLQGHPFYSAAEHVTSLEALVKGKQKMIYVMKRAEGETLWKRIQEKKDVFESIVHISDFLACIHARFPYSPTQEREDILAHAKDRLQSKTLFLPEALQQRFVENYIPVLRSLDDAVYVFNKDAHPENWILSQSRICCIDNDHTALVPIQFDLVNLMEYGPYLSFEQKMQVISSYISSYNGYYGKEVIKDKDRFILGYLNAIVHRSIALSTAWSQPGREKMGEHRKIIVHNALKSIDDIEHNYRTFYETYKENYHQLRIALGEYLHYFK